MANENGAREGVTEAARFRPFRPSDVVLPPHVPLVGTMGRAEVEAAAGWMLLDNVTIQHAEAPDA